MFVYLKFIRITILIIIYFIRSTQYLIFFILKSQVFPLIIPGGASDKEPTYQSRRHNSCEFNPWVGKIPWSRTRQPTPVFLPGKSHGWRSLAGYSPWGRKELDTTERLHFHFFHFSYCIICLFSINLSYLENSAHSLFPDIHLHPINDSSPTFMVFSRSTELFWL